MYTSIKISRRLKDILDKMKITDNESYEELIESLIEDHLEMNSDFKEDLYKSFNEYKEGKTVGFSEIKARIKK